MTCGKNVKLSIDVFNRRIRHSFERARAGPLSARNSLFWPVGTRFEEKDVSCRIYVVEAEEATAPKAAGLEGFNSKGLWQRST